MTYTLNGTVAVDPELPLVNTGTVLAPPDRFDTNASNDAASDTDVVGILADSFD